MLKIDPLAGSDLCQEGESRADAVDVPIDFGHPACLVQRGHAGALQQTQLSGGGGRRVPARVWMCLKDAYAMSTVGEEDGGRYSYDSRTDDHHVEFIGRHFCLQVDRVS